MINGHRKEDQGRWGQIDAFLDRFGRLLFAVAVAASTWFMAHVVAPLKAIPSVVTHQHWQDSAMTKRQEGTDSLFRVVNQKLDNAEADRGRMVDILATLAALQCEQFTPREKQTSILCRKIISTGRP